MPDWNNEASREIEKTRFSPAEREEISRELAGYLEDLCADARCRGMDESAATQSALDELNEDARLGAKLHRARKENLMHLNDRTKRFWLPGMSMLFGSVALLVVFDHIGLQPHFTRLWLHGGVADSHALYWPLMIYYPWLCCLPFLGAAGAYWSRRAGGRRAVQAAAGFFSVFVFIAILLTVLLFAFVISGVTGNLPMPQTLSPEFAGAVVSWIVIPSLALLLGILPVLFQRHPLPHRAASL